MGIRSIRFGSNLGFDEYKEKDIIEAIEYLNSRHKTGQFISNLIRLALENPEIIEGKNGKYKKGELINTMESLGMSPLRYKYIESIANETRELHAKVDKIYEMTLQLYGLAQMGKRLNLDKRSENLMQAGFLLEKQLRDIERIVGNGLKAFESDKIEDKEKIADDILELLINSNDGIITEIQNEKPINYIVAAETNVANNSQPQKIYVDTAQYSDDTTKVKNEEPKKADNNNLNSNDDDDEVVDFGDADLTALAAFFGNA